MEIFARWVHPLKVRKDGRLKPSAFRLEDIKAGLLTTYDTKCPEQALSLADLSLLTQDNSEASLKAACKFCEYGRHKKSERWPDNENCDCPYGEYGTKGALASGEALVTSLMDACVVTAHVAPDAHPDNPLHALLCFCAKNGPDMDSIDLADQIQKTPITAFSRVRPAKEILVDHLADIINQHS